MSTPQVKVRTYRSEIRERRARATRRRIREAAAALFLERGYVATSVADIAARADVAAKTIYLTYPSKRAILDEAIGVALGGDDEAVRIVDRDWAREILEAPREMVPALFARYTTALLRRSAGLLEVAEAAAAADPDVAARRDLGRMNRRQDLQRVAQVLADSPGAIDHATDVLYAIASPAVYTMLVVQSGWSPARFESWLAAAIAAQLL